MENSHNHNPIEINPDELTPGSVIVSLKGEQGTPATIQTHKFNLQTHQRTDKTAGQASPIEYVLSGLGLSLAQILNASVQMHGIALDGIHVAVSFRNEGVNDRGVANTVITREIVLDGHIRAEDRIALEQAIETCPVQKILQGNLQIQTLLT